MSTDHSTKSICSFPECGRPVRAQCLCITHWYQQRKGQPLRAIRHQIPRNRQSVRHDEVPCTDPNLNGPCHVYRGRKQKGYGVMTINGKPVRVHRYTWELANGPIPDNLVIDHMCRNRACCNINHLRLVTAAVNCLENSVGLTAVHAAKTHCIRGHPFDEVNTYLIKGGGRMCKECNRTAKQLRRKIAKAAGLPYN